jgi:TolB-like protein/Tfp pilus assembly protein PilF
MAVLQALARSPGQLVSRTDLLAEIWPGGAIYDEALTQCVYQLRQQLASAGGDDYPNLITTVPKRGYLLNGAVHAIDPEPAEARTSTAPGRNRRAMVGMLAALLILGAAWAIFEWRDAKDAESAPPRTQAVAVLPFLPLVEGNRDPVLELGMADTLIARLSGAGQIIVRPLTSVRRYAEIERDALQAGRELGVDAVVEGSIQRSGEAMRVTVRLLRVADGAALWADTFNEQFSSILLVQDDISERIATALAPELGQQVRKNLARGGTSSIEAYERYLKGRYHLARLTPPDLRAGVGFFREAVALDPNYAEAWLGLASAQVRLPMAGEALPKEFYPAAKHAAQKALAIDPSLAEGHAMLGWIAHWFEWDWAGSEAHFRRAIELNPNDTESHLGYAHLLSNTGRHEQALAEVRRSRELSPFYLTAATLEGSFLLRAQRSEEALQTLEAARELNENFWLTRAALAGAYAAVGRNEDALEEARLASRLSAGSTWAAANEVGILARLGRRAEAEAVLGEMLQRSADRYVPPYDIALAYIELEDPVAAFDWLERAYDVHDPKLSFLGAEWRWNSVRSRPEFVELMSRINLDGSAGVAAEGASRATDATAGWSIHGGPVEWQPGQPVQVVGRFEVRAPAAGPTAETALLQGGACLVADLVPFGIGRATCATNADCNGPGAFDRVRGSDTEGYLGYCAARDGSNEPPRCWTRPGPAGSHCRRSVDGLLLTEGVQEVGPVAADALENGEPYPEWAVYACMAHPGHDRACGEPVSPNRQVSLTPLPAEAE